MAQSKFSSKEADRMGCFICFADFDQPKQLPCLHIFCLKCLKTYREDKTDEDAKPCPVCHKEFCISTEDLEKLPDCQFMIKYLVKKSPSREENEANKCDICAEIGENVEAEAFCKECKQSLCPRCKKTHSVTTSTKFHTVVGIEEKYNEESSLETMKSYCIKHLNKELEFYCCDCDVLMCYICLFENHGKHNCKLLHDVVEQKKKEFVIDESKIKHCYEEGCELLRKRQQKQEKTLFEVTEAALHIEEAFDNIIKLLTARKTQLLNTLESIKENTLKEIDSQEDFDQMYDAELNCFLSFCRMVMERGTDCEIIRVADELHKRAEELIKSQDERNKQQLLPDRCIKFVASPELMPLDIERLVGKVSDTGDGASVLLMEAQPQPSFLSLPSSDTESNIEKEDLNLSTSRSASPKTGLSPALTHLIAPKNIDYAQLNGYIKGITVVNDQLFYITDSQPQVSVYDTSTGKTKPYLKIPGLMFPQGIAGCSHNKALYISDFRFSCIHRVDLSNGFVDHLGMKKLYNPRGLSVTSEHNILVTVHVKGSKENERIVEYTGRGQQIRDIELSRSIKDAWQVLEVSTDQFILCHGRWQSSLHRLCLINSAGKIIKSYGKKPGSVEGKLDEPHSIAFDNKTGRVFVAGSANNRILMFTKDLALIGQIQSRDLATPMCICVDSSGQLYVTEWRTGRMLVISVPD